MSEPEEMQPGMVYFSDFYMDAHNAPTSAWAHCLRLWDILKIGDCWCTACTECVCVGARGVVLTLRWHRFAPVIAPMMPRHSSESWCVAFYVPPLHSSCPCWTDCWLSHHAFCLSDLLLLLSDRVRAETMCLKDCVQLSQSSWLFGNIACVPQLLVLCF